MQSSEYQPAGFYTDQPEQPGQPVQSSPDDVPVYQPSMPTISTIPTNSDSTAQQDNVLQYISAWQLNPGSPDS